MLSLLSMLWVSAGIFRSYGAWQGIEAAIDSYEHGKFQNAAAMFAGLSGRDPKDDSLRLWLGRTYFKLHRWDDAIREFEQAVELAPQNGLAHLWLARATGEKAAHGSYFSAIGLARKTCREFEAAVKLSADNLDARFDLLEYYAQAPAILGGGRDKANAQAAAIAVRAPRAGYAARAGLFEKDRAWDRVLAELTQATLKYPDDPDGFADLAEFLLKRRDYEGAGTNARKALALDSSHSRAGLLAAAAAIELRTGLEAAITTLQNLAAGSLRDHDPAFEEVYYWLGRAYLARGQKAEARQALQASLGFDPDHERAKEVLSRIK